jgi:uncharacterized membrane protein HdeD (DUF308 family)
MRRLKALVLLVGVFAILVGGFAVLSATPVQASRCNCWVMYCSELPPYPCWCKCVPCPKLP